MREFDFLYPQTLESIRSANERIMKGRITLSKLFRLGTNLILDQTFGREIGEVDQVVLGDNQIVLSHEDSYLFPEGSSLFIDCFNKGFMERWEIHRRPKLSPKGRERFRIFVSAPDYISPLTNTESFATPCEISLDQRNLRQMADVLWNAYWASIFRKQALLSISTRAC